MAGAFEAAPRSGAAWCWWTTSSRPAPPWRRCRAEALAKGGRRAGAAAGNFLREAAASRFAASSGRTFHRRHHGGQSRHQRVRPDRAERGARRQEASEQPDLDFVAVNDLTDTRTLAHLLKYDSVHGRFDGTVRPREGDGLVVNGDTMKVLSEKDPASAALEGPRAWTSCSSPPGGSPTGTRPPCTSPAGARKVIISAPAKKEDITIVYGVNHDKYDPAKAPRHLQRQLHHQLPGAGGQGHPGEVRLRARLHDDGPQLHQRPEDPRPARTRTCAGPAPRPCRSSRPAPAPPRPPRWSFRR